MKNNNYICYVPYLRNSIAYDHDFCYTCVKWEYLQAFFFFFLIFIFLAVRGVRRQKMAQDEKLHPKFLLFGLLWREGGQGWKCKKESKMKNINYICQVPYIRNNIAYDLDFWYTCVKWYLKAFFSFSQNFDFSGL